MVGSRDTERMTCRGGAFLAAAFVVFVVPGCALELDYGPPDRDTGSSFDAGSIDAGRRDGSVDGGSGRCRTERDCDDGDPCNGQELCVSSRCQAGTPVVCTSENVCLGTSTCDPATGDCVLHDPPTCPPDDGNPCNGTEICDPAVGCTTTAPLDCNDGIDCTIDSCDPIQHCVHSGDDTRCSAAPGGVCGTGGCTYPTCEVGVTCTSDDPCFVPVCDRTGGCVRNPVVCRASEMCCGGHCVRIGCADGNDCTDDACDRATGCVHTPHVGACDDGNVCTVNDFCSGTACTSRGTRVCPATDLCHAASCDPVMGCAMAPLSGNPCSDGDACTVGDVCNAGTCTPGMGVPLCDDANPCTADACDRVLGCTSTPLMNGTMCSITTLMGTTLEGTCMDGVCTNITGCPVGRADCDHNGTCECIGTCGGAGTCATLDCMVAGGCGTGQLCCMFGRNAGTCYDPSCLGCCM
jgi:hypothetical protein